MVFECDLDPYLRPGRHLAEFSRAHPDAWQFVDQARRGRGHNHDWPDWCFLPLAASWDFLSQGGTILLSLERKAEIGIMGSLAAWRVTQGIYTFDPTVYDAVLKTPVTGDIPVEILLRLPEYCVYIGVTSRNGR